MVSPTPRPIRAASVLAVAAVALGLAGQAGVASGQVMFNPYMPYNSQYYSYVVPSVPNNLALPGAARGAMEYNAAWTDVGGSGSRFNSFDRWVQDYESEVSGRRSRGGSLDLRRPDVAGNRGGYVPNREADRRFQAQEERRNRDYFEQEDERQRIATQRDIYYQAATRSTDPARKAAYLRVAARLADPNSRTARDTLAEIDEARNERQGGDTRDGARPGSSSTSRATNAPRPPASIAAPANREDRLDSPVRPTPSSGAGAANTRSATAAPAVKPAATPTPSATTPTPSAGTPARRSTPEPVVPERRPPMDSESRERPSAADRAPAPPPGLAPLVAPDPIPDEPPPRDEAPAPR